MRTGYIPQKITRVIPFRKRPTKRTAEEYLNYAEQGLVTPVKVSTATSFIYNTCARCRVSLGAICKIEIET